MTRPAIILRRREISNCAHGVLGHGWQASRITLDGRKLSRVYYAVDRNTVIRFVTSGMRAPKF